MTGNGLNMARLSGPGLRAFFAIAGRWALTDEEQMGLLGLHDRPILARWRAGKDIVLERETLERISCVLSIYESLAVLLPEPPRADAWVRSPNRARPFGGRSALDLMLQGDLDDLLAVRRYLSGQHPAIDRGQ